MEGAFVIMLHFPIFIWNKNTHLMCIHYVSSLCCVIMQDARDTIGK